MALEFLRREIELGADLIPEFRGDLRPKRDSSDRPVVARKTERTSNDLAPLPPPLAAAVRSEVPRAPDDPLVDPAIGAACDLTALREVLGDCTRCKLSAGRNNIVFGVGNPNADLVFVGEGPGEQEDLDGLPFVGKAGQLLTDIIEKGIGIPRDDVYILNAIKCRPPNNRDPQPDEIVACDPFMLRQIELVNPKVIVTLGNFATQSVLRQNRSISKLRGQWCEANGYPVMPTFHPAYLLRTPSKKREVWADIQLVMARLGLSKRGGRR